jgi:hypothetical protein
LCIADASSARKFAKGASDEDALVQSSAVAVDVAGAVDELMVCGLAVNDIVGTLEATAALGCAMLGPYIDPDAPLCATSGCVFFRAVDSTFCSHCVDQRQEETLYLIGADSIKESDVIQQLEASDGQLQSGIVDSIILLLRDRLPSDMVAFDTAWWESLHLPLANMVKLAAPLLRLPHVFRMLCAVYVPGHYELIHVDFHTGVIDLFDSLQIYVDEAQQATLIEFLHFVSPTTQSWEVRMSNCGKQHDTVSCGVFVLHHAKLVVRGKPLTGSNVPSATNRRTNRREVMLIRKQLAREIRQGALESHVVLLDRE